ncbi:MAG: hypothetical protein ABF326_04255 [Arenicellales bacterium]
MDSNIVFAASLIHDRQYCRAYSSKVKLSSLQGSPGKEVNINVTCQEIPNMLLSLRRMFFSAKFNPHNPGTENIAKRISR